MSIFNHSVQPMYTDFNFRVSPAEMARMIISDAIFQLDYDGIPRLRLIEEKQGSWMVDKFRLEQLRPISYPDEIVVDLQPRREKGVRIYYTALVTVGQELAAKAEISFFAVNFHERSIIRLSELEPMWNCPAEKGGRMEKAACKGEMEQLGKYTVRYSDCDSNRHLTSPKYLDYVCDVTGFWVGEEKLCALMQVDYVSECRPGEEIVFLGRAEGEKQFVRGVHPDGSTAFDAVCSYN